jgi:hypothetical protein
MTPLRAAALLVSVFLASTVAAQTLPPDFNKAYEAVRLKAKKAYVSVSPIDFAVSLADLKSLEPAHIMQATPERVKKTAELAEAIDAVRALQGAPGRPVLAAAHKGRLMGLVYQRLGLSEAEQSKAIGEYHAGVVAPSPFAGGPSQGVLARSRAGATAAPLRASSVMKGSAALSGGRGFAGGFPAAKPLMPRAEGITAADFRPHYTPAKSHDVPGAQAAATREPPSLWQRAVALAKTPLPGLSGAAHAYEKFAERRMARSEQLDRIGAAKLEKGGVVNTVSAGWDAVKGWGNRLAAGDSRAVTEVAIGATLVVVAVVAAPVIVAAAAGAGTAALVVGGLHVAVAGLTAYGAVKGTAALIKEPNYVTAGALAANFLGAKYAEPLVEKVGHFAGKIAYASAEKASIAAVERTALAGAVVAGGATATNAASTAGVQVARVATEVTVDSVRVAAKTTAEVAAESAHHFTKEAVIDSLEHAVPVKDKTEPKH